MGEFYMKSEDGEYEKLVELESEPKIVLEKVTIKPSDIDVNASYTLTIPYRLRYRIMNYLTWGWRNRGHIRKRMILKASWRNRELYSCVPGYDIIAKQKQLKRRKQNDLW